jgi:hypothetical protein
MARGSWDEWDEDVADEYDRARPTEWDTLDEALAAAEASPALRDGSVVITWVRHGPEGAESRRYSWRSTALGMDLPRGAEMISRRRKGAWETA